MKKNIGKKDRLIRCAIATLMLAYAIWQSSILAYIGAAFVYFEALKSWCVLYAITGKNTCQK